MSKKKDVLAQDLQACYSQQARHFHQTRRKKRPEIDILLEHMHPFVDSKQGSVSFLDIWCGSWRLCGLLTKEFPWRVDYQWVDFSEWMIAVAKQEYQEWSFVCDEMISYLSQLPQESQDIAVFLASLQHLQTVEERRLALSHVYKSLTWWGMCLLINRSYSHRFIKKYWKQMFSSLPAMITAGRSRNDIMIPWKDPNFQKNNKTYTRYYHIFTLPEIRLLATEAWFVIENDGYIQRNGQLLAWSSARKTSRNTFLCLRKWVCLSL